MYLSIGRALRFLGVSISTYLTKSFQKISIEDLHIKGMLKNHKLARAISDIVFGEFRRQLEY